MKKIIPGVLCFLIATPAIAGSCKIQSVNGQSVQVCDNGYTETIGRGVKRSYGIRNGGIERYPGNSVPPYAIDRRR